MTFPPVPDTVTRRVLFHIYSYTVATGIPSQPFMSVTAKRGDTITISPQEAARGEALSALGTDEQAAAVEQRAGEPAAVDDTQLRSMTADDLIVYLGTRPSDAERVRELEEGRATPRKTVLAAIERVIEARDDAAADAAEQERLSREAVAAGAPAIPG